MRGFDGLTCMSECSADDRRTRRMTMNRLSRLCIGFTALLLATAPAGAAELYKWVDENGVTNYSNNPPPKSKTGKAATIVEDRVSVYTPEKAVTDALERRAQQQKPAAAPPAPPTATAPPAPKAAASPPPPPIAYDPCMTVGDPNCNAILYDSSPVFQGRRRPPPLNQPQLPAGAIAGQVTGQSGYIAGQSGSAPPATPSNPRQREPAASFTLKPREPERERDRR